MKSSLFAKCHYASEIISIGARILAKLAVKAERERCTNDSTRGNRGNNLAILITPSNPLPRAQ